MSQEKSSELGSIVWTDLTVKDADGVSEFYQNVVGWRPGTVSMGDYDDFTMNLKESGDTVAGVCHAKGSNASLPAQWLMYVKVASVLDCIDIVENCGGKIIDGPRKIGSGSFCVIEDPAGAVLALIDE